MANFGRSSTRLAARIASFPPNAIAAAEEAVNNALLDPVPGLGQEDLLFSQCLLDPEAIRRMERFLELGGQTRDVELDVTNLYSKLS